MENLLLCHILFAVLLQYHLNAGSLAANAPPVHQLIQSDEQQGFKFECAGILLKAQLLSHPVSLLHPLWFLPVLVVLEDSRPPATDDLFCLPEDPRYETSGGLVK